MITQVLIFCLLLQTINSKPQIDGPARSCTTADNESGICIPLQSCKAKAINELANRSSLFPDELKYLQQSLCDQSSSNIVCCPGSSQPATTVSTTQIPATTTRTDPQPPVSKATTLLNPISTVSARKCKEYQDLAPNCSLRSQSLILNGKAAGINEFPHMALIGFKRRGSGRTDWSCGGSLISELFVLTAAHCEDIDNDPATYARLGEHDISRTDEVKATVDYDVIKRIVHPRYQRFYNDVMLLKLNRMVQFNSAIRPICLPEQFDIPAQSAIASGWGLTMAYGSRSDVLLKANVDFFSQKDCSDKYRRNSILSMGILESAHLCAGSRVDNTDTCQGDSGGPLQIFKDDRKCIYTILGVTSFGPGLCGTTGTPGVYARVYPYLAWIEQNVWPNEK